MEQKFTEDYMGDMSNGIMTSLGFVLSYHSADINNVKNGITLITATHSDTISIVDNSGIPHTLTLVQLNILLMELLGAVQQLNQKDWQLCQLVDSCTTIAQIRAINWQTIV